MRGGVGGGKGVGVGVGGSNSYECNGNVIISIIREKDKENKCC